MTKDLTQHIETLRTLAALASISTDLNMRSKAATLEWLADEIQTALEIRIPPKVKAGSVVVQGP